MTVKVIIKQTDTNFDAIEGYTQLSIDKRADGTLYITMAENDFIEIILLPYQVAVFKQWLMGK
jgi:hypothetical protein